MSKATRITLIVCATVLLLGLGVLAWLSGSPIDLSEILAALGGAASGILVWLCVKGGYGKPQIPGPTTVVGMLCLSMLVGGCSVGQAQVAARTTISSSVQGVSSADRITAPLMEDASAEALSEVAAECNDCSGDDAVAMYNSRMEPWSEMSRGYRASIEFLLALDEAVQIWIVTDSLPEQWPALCSASGEAVRALVAGVVEATGGNAPAMLAGVPVGVDRLCVLVQPFLPEGEDDDELD